MKKMLSVVVGACLLVACASFAFAAEQMATMAKKQAGEPGAIAVMVATATATVQSVDTAKRTVELKMPDGKVKTFKLGKEVRNFDQIKVGDQVKTTYVDELTVFLRKADVPPSSEEVTNVMLAPKGAKPGVIAADTTQMSAKIMAVDAKKRTVTLMGPEGNSKTLKVAKTVNLKGVKKGDDVVVRYTEALAILVEKPRQPKK
jgi:hypothetical protein